MSFLNSNVELNRIFNTILIVRNISGNGRSRLNFRRYPEIIYYNIETLSVVVLRKVIVKMDLWG